MNTLGKASVCALCGMGRMFGNGGRALAMSIGIVAASLAKEAPEQRHGVFVPDGEGRLHAEVETAPTVSAWRLETQSGGFTGQGYYAWRGSHSKTRPGTAVLSYRVSITQAGRYSLAIRARRDREGSTPRPNDQVNDVFVRFDGQGEWTKISHKTPWGQWGWMRQFLHRHRREAATVEFGSGEHYVEIAARSDNVKIDSLLLVFIEPTGCGCS